MHEFPVLGANIVSGDGAKQLPVELEDVGVPGPAQPHGILSHSVKNGLEIESRATNDLKHFCCRGLLFTCFVKLSSKPCDHILSRAGSSPEALNRITAWILRWVSGLMAPHGRPGAAQDGRW